MILRVLLMMAVISLTHFTEANEKKENTAFEALLELDWCREGTYSLPRSHATLTVPEEYYILMGENAVQERFLVDGHAQSQVEAVVYNSDFSSCIIFKNFDEGYVKLDDWDDIDPQLLLTSISQNTEEANQDKIKRGMSTLHVIGWIQEPFLDRKTNTVYWSIEAKNEEGILINSVALKLGSKGYEKLTWVTQKDSYVQSVEELEIMLSAYNYDKGFRYSDYKPGDKFATYGIATLVAATAGGKILKAGGFLVLLKKLGGFIFAAIAVGFYKLKHFLKTKIFRVGKE